MIIHICKVKTSTFNTQYNFLCKYLISFVLQLIKTFVTKKETKDETIFTVVAPPNVGFYKLEIFGGKIPKLNGMLHLPLVAIYLVEVRLQFSSESGENEDKKSEPSPTYVYRDRGKLEDVIEEKN